MIGLSIHSGAHIGYTQRVMDLLKEKGMADRFVLLVGGAIASKDFEVLKQLGAANVYGPGSMIKDIVGFIKEKINK
jgi:methylmalonyl-CoA mutase C-terminal domain/subunit